MKLTGNTLRANKPILNKRTLFKGLLLIIILFIGILVGILISSQKYKSVTSRGEQDASFRLGLVKSNLTVTNIKWSNFPGWRNIEFNVNGTFSVNLPTDAQIEFCDITNADSINEVARKSFTFKEGNNKLHYDYVTYEIANGTVEALGILKEYEVPIVIATTGYYVRASWTPDESCILGYIPPESTVYTNWTALQSEHSDTDLTPYLNAFKMSRTYIDETLNAKQSIQDIVLVKTKEGLLNCRIENNQSTDWIYSADLPSIELWYNGVWIELETPYGSIANSISPANQTKEINVPKSTNDAYPDLFPGIYRLVVYGAGNDCIISDSFIIDSNQNILLLK